MISVVVSFASFLIAITVLVSFHEYGHFLMARWMGIKVISFSIGFGKALFKYRDRHGTEYLISSIPLGGYLKVLDESEMEVPPVDLPKAFNRKHPLQKMAVVLAGPLFNFVLAFFILWLLFTMGFPTIQPILGYVTPHSAAELAGFQKGQLIIAVDHQPVHSWPEIQKYFVHYLGAKQATISIKTQTKNHPPKTHTLNIKNWHPDPRQPDFLESLGLSSNLPPLPTEIAAVEQKGPAHAAGLKAGDKILTVDNIPVSDFSDMTDIVKAHPNEGVQFKILRGHKIHHVTIVPMLDPQTKLGRIGVQSTAVIWPKDWFYTERYSLLEATKKAMQEIGSTTALTFGFIVKLATGHASWRYLGGPIGIAKGAGISMSYGFIYFLKFLAMISMTLGLINLVPVPMLDGGYFVFYFIEWIIRRPLPQKAYNWGNRIGFFILIGLIVVAFTNDIMSLLNELPFR